LSKATAVSRIEDLEFLLDVIPKTTTYKQFKEKRAREAAQETELEKGQQTLNGTSAATENGVNRTPGGQSLLQSQLNNGDGHPPAEAPTPTLPTVAMMVDRTVETTPPTNGDVEMSE
jgi:DNA-directed RNA polymerase I subunit RPA43